MSDLPFIRRDTQSRMPWGLMSDGQNYNIKVYGLRYGSLCHEQVDSTNIPNELLLDDDVACLRRMVSRPLVRYKTVYKCTECQNFAIAGPGVNFLRAGPAKVFAIDELLLHMIDTHSIVLPEAFLAAIRRDFVVWSEYGGDPNRWGDFLTDEFFTRRDWLEWPEVYDSMYETA